MNMPTTILMSSLLLSIPARSQERDLRKLIPSDSFGYVQFAGIKACSKSANTLPLVKLVKGVLGKLPRELFMEELEAGMNEGRDEMRNGLMALGLDPVDLAKVLECPAVISIGRPTFIGPALVPSVLLAVDTSSAGDAVTQVISTLETLAGMAGNGQVELTETTQGRMKITIFEHNKFPGRVSLARGNGYLMLGVGKHYFAKAMDCLNGKGKSLRVPQKLLIRGADNSPLMSSYFDTRPFLDWLGPFIPYEVLEIADILGLGSIDGIYSASWVEQGHLRDYSRLGFRGNSDGMLQQLLTGSVNSKAARHCPDNTLLFMNASLKPEALFTAISKIKRMLPHGIKRYVRLPKHSAEIATLIGPELAVSIAMPKTMPGLPEIRVFIGLRDEQKAMEAIQQIMRQFGDRPWKSRGKDGSKIYYGPRVKVGPLAIMPAFTIKDGMLIVGSQMRDLRRDMKNPMPLEESLAGNPSFAKNLKRSKSPSAFLHMGLKNNIAAAWKLARPFAMGTLDAHGMEDVDLDAILPDPQALSAALTDPSFSLKLDDKGLQFFVQDDPMGAAALLAYFSNGLDYFFQGLRGKIR